MSLLFETLDDIGRLLALQEFQLVINEVSSASPMDLDVDERVALRNFIKSHSLKIVPHGPESNPHQFWGVWRAIDPPRVICPQHDTLQ